MAPHSNTAGGLPPVEPDPLIGQVLGGRFQLLEVAGRGAMGTVYLASHTVLPRQFAVKVLKPSLAKSAEFVGRFRREAIAASRIDHPNVVTLFDFGQLDNGPVYLVMEFLKGVGMDEVLGHQRRLPLNRALPILVQLADALDCAHDVQVVHRDLKPQNILLTEKRRRRDVVKILDFGVAKLFGPQENDDRITLQGQIFGTAEYMFPEQAQAQELDGRSDIYSVGCIAYELITGDPPFVGKHPMEVIKAHLKEPAAPPSTKLRDLPVPAALDGLILRCLAKDPDERYQTGAELCQDLLRVQNLLVGMAAEIAGSFRPAGQTPDPTPTGATGLNPSLVSGTFPATAPRPLAVSGRGMQLTSQPGQPQSEQLREEFHLVLRELAMALVQAALCPPQTAEALGRLLVAEEELVGLTGTIALTEQGFDRLRFDYGQKEKRLRTAIMDLRMDRAKVQGQLQAAPDQAAALQSAVDDLTFQIGVLTRRTQEVLEERGTQIRELDTQVTHHRAARQEREREVHEIYQQILAEIEAWRPRARTAGLLELYARLDAARARIDAARAG